MYIYVQICLLNTMHINQALYAADGPYITAVVDNHANVGVIYWQFETVHTTKRTQ